MHIQKFFVEKKHTHTNPFYKLYLILQKQKKSSKIGISKSLDTVWL